MAAFLALEGRRTDKTPFRVHEINIVNGIMGNYLFSIALRAYIFDAAALLHQLPEDFQNV